MMRSDKLPDYKEIYLTMVRETEKAIDILIEVQKKCEEMVISGEESHIIAIHAWGKQPDDGDRPIQPICGEGEKTEKSGGKD